MLTALGALKIANPKEWERSVRAAMKTAKGRIPDAAVTLGVSPRTLFRWLAEPPLDNVQKAASSLHVKGKKR